jgi:hypothetical protein
MSCPEITRAYATQTVCDYNKFLQLPRDQATALNDWFEYTWKMRENPVEEHRRGMLQAWALLGFMGRVTTGSTAEEDWVAAFLVNSDLENIFNTVMENPKSLMRMYAKRFSLTWPIYSSTDLIKHDIRPSNLPVRADIVQAYGQHSGLLAQPACWLRHLDANETLLPDWQHTLAAWHTVAGNILDPNGWHPTEMDLRIITNSFMSMVYFYKEGKVFFETPSHSPDIFDRTQIFSSL